MRNKFKKQEKYFSNNENEYLIFILQHENFETF